jgi:hypothetical protein
MKHILKQTQVSVNRELIYGNVILDEDFFLLVRVRKVKEP